MSLLPLTTPGNYYWWLRFEERRILQKGVLMSHSTANFFQFYLISKKKKKKKELLQTHFAKILHYEHLPTLWINDWASLGLSVLVDRQNHPWQSSHFGIFMKGSLINDFTSSSGLSSQQWKNSLHCRLQKTKRRMLRHCCSCRVLLLSTEQKLWIIENAVYL